MFDEEGQFFGTKKDCNQRISSNEGIDFSESFDPAMSYSHSIFGYRFWIVFLNRVFIYLLFFSLSGTRNFSI